MKKYSRSSKSVTEIPEYKRALISYIDIMGFKELLYNGADDADSIRRKVLEVQRHLTHDSDELESPFEGGADIAFSDTVLTIRYIADPGKYRSGILFHELSRLQLAQVELLNKGILVRGGMALGDVYVDAGKEVWFGPGIVSAYELEASADFPRIILDPTIMRAFRTTNVLRSRNNSLKDETRYVSSMISRDEDGLLYIDPFAIDSGSFDEGVEGMIAWYASVRANLVTGAGKYANNLRVLRKYVWLANKYRRAVLQMSGTYQRQLDIGPDEFPELHPLSE